MNREQLREYVKQLPQEQVLRELLISQVDCNTKLEEVRAIAAEYQASKKAAAKAILFISVMMVIGLAINLIVAINN